MHQHYNIEAAGNCFPKSLHSCCTQILHPVIALRKFEDPDSSSDDQLSYYAKVNCIATQFYLVHQLIQFFEDSSPAHVDVQYFQKPQMWRFVRKVDEESEELVLKVQGVLCQKHLPPFVSRYDSGFFISIS